MRSFQTHFVTKYFIWLKDLSISNKLTKQIGGLNVTVFIERRDRHTTPYFFQMSSRKTAQCMTDLRQTVVSCVFPSTRQHVVSELSTRVTAHSSLVR